MATNIETVLSARGHLQQQNGARIRTLVVDDTPDFLNAVCAILEERPAIDIVGTATNGLDALRAAEELRPELVIMDVSMPVLNGLEAAMRLCVEMPWVKLLMMSADDAPEVAAACLHCGADAFLWKGRLAEGLDAHLSEIAPRAGAQDTVREEPAEAVEAAAYEFHNQSYEYYRNLLEYAQAVGSRTMATSAARMLLFHLRQMFRRLPAAKQQGMKLALALGEV